jgi:hypothetical protein
MRILKQFSTVMTVMAVLVAPFGVMGCAENATTPATNEPAETETGEDTDLGEPGESGSQL